MTARPCFHLAVPVTDIAASRAFYGGVLGLARGGRPNSGSTGTSTVTRS